MDAERGWGDLRSALNERCTPDEASWRRLLALIAALPEAQRLDAARYTASHLDAQRWPATLRRWRASGAQVDDWMAPLPRTLSWDQHDEATHARMLALFDEGELALDALTLDTRHISLTDLVKLWQSPALRNLRKIRLQETRWTKATSRALHTLAHAPFLSRLEHLTLDTLFATSPADFANTLHALLSQCRALTSIEVSDLEHAPGLAAASDIVTALARGLAATPLRRFHSERLAMRPQEVATLVESGCWRSVETLRLDWSIRGTPCAKALSKLDTSSLTTLSLIGSDIGAAGFNALLDTPMMARLTALDLNQNLLSPPSQSMSALAHSDMLPRLELLGLGSTEIGPGHLGNLLDAGLHRLRALDLSRTRISDQGADALIAAALPNLRYLDVSASQTAPAALARLREALGEQVQIHAQEAAAPYWTFVHLAPFFDRIASLWHAHPTFDSGEAHGAE